MFGCFSAAPAGMAASGNINATVSRSKACRFMTPPFLSGNVLRAFVRWVRGGFTTKRLAA
jgi:hypothetical protein